MKKNPDSNGKGTSKDSRRLPSAQCETKLAQVKNILLVRQAPAGGHREGRLALALFSAPQTKSARQS